MKSLSQSHKRFFLFLTSSVISTTTGYIINQLPAIPNFKNKDQVVTALVVLLTLISFLIIWITTDSNSSNIDTINLDSGMSRQESFNRKALLNNVKKAWVDGVLEKALHEQVPIILGLESHPEAVASPWNIELINPDKSHQVFPSDMTVIDVFDQLGEGGTLLILGKPGSGKTITLLQLARDLINRAELDIDRRIPVVLNLSSWAAGKLTLAKWIVEELNSKYHVNRKIAQQWIDKQNLLLLLDGLDEIRDLEKRKACVVALNTFQQEQAVEMVVCCRVKDYEDLGNPLKLRSALALQPLTTDQVETHLDQLQSNVIALKIMLNQDDALKELAESPLLLNIMVLTYQGIEVNNISEVSIAVDRKRRLFEDFLNRIFQGSRPYSYLPNIRTKTKECYPRKKATYWLAWMAKQMIQNSQTIFLIEKLQFNYILDSKQYFHYYHDRVERIFSRLENIEITWIRAFIAKLYNIEYFYDLTLVIPHLFVYIGFLLTISQIICQLFPEIWFATAFPGAFLSSIFLCFYFFSEIKPVESVKFYTTWDSKRFWLISMRIVKHILIFCLSFGLFFGASFRLLDSVILGLYGLYYGFVLGIMEGLFLGIIFSFKVSLVPVFVDTYEYPNQGIKKSSTNFTIFGIISAIIILVVYIFFNAFYTSFDFGFVGAIFFILLCFGMPFGGKACLQHLVLRIILFLGNYVPWNYSRFLDWASSKIFLQKVGGGYIFIHRSLMEYFSEMENTL